MTLEVDPCAEVSLVRERLADACGYADFSKGVVRDCDVIVLLEDNEVEREGDYGSYVMVNGSDAVSDDSVAVDLNAEGELECFGDGSVEIDPEFEVSESRIKKENDAKSCVSVESGGISQVVEKSLGESASDSQNDEFDFRNNVLDVDQKQGDEKEMQSSEKVKEISKSHHSVFETADYCTSDPQANRGEEKHENKNTLDSNGIVAEPEISIMEVEAFVPDQNGDVVYAADAGNTSNANGEDTAYGKNNLVLKENQFDANGEDFVVGQSGEEEADSEKNLVAISTNEASTVLERENANVNQVDAAFSEENHLDENGDDFSVGQSKEEEGLEKYLQNVSTNEASIVLERENENANQQAGEEDALSDKNIFILEEKHLNENIEDFSVGQSREEEDDLKNTLTTVSTTDADILLERENANANDADAANDKNILILEENRLAETGDVFVAGQSREEEDLEKNLENVSTNEENIVLERENPKTNDEDASNDKYNMVLEGNQIDQKGEDFVVGQSIQEEDDFVKKLGTVSANEANLHLEMEKTDNAICHGNDDCPSARQDQDANPQTAEVVSASDGCEVASGKNNCMILGICNTIMDNMAVVPSEEHDVDLDKSLEKSTVTDTRLSEDENPKAGGSVSGEKGDGFPTSPSSSFNSVLEGKRQLESTQRTPSVMVGSVAINCEEMFPSLPFNNAAIKSFLKAKTPTSSQELSSSVVEDVKLVEEVKNVSENIENPDHSCLLDANIEAKPANGAVEEHSQSSILGDDDRKLSSLSDDASEVQSIVAEVVSGPFYLVRYPRYEDDITREKIKHAQSLVDQKTRIRESLQAQIKTTKATCKEFGSNLDAAKSNGKAARELLKAKRKEIDSAQSIINKAKNAMSIDDIGIRINKLEHMIAHETLPLKEEKQLVREIKQWTQLRDQLSLDAGKQSELQLALNQKDQIEERLTLLCKELDSIKDSVVKADTQTMSAKKIYGDQRAKFNELQSQFEAANKIRQEAYAHLQSLKQPYKEKLNYFGKYKSDAEEAKNLALSRDRVKLQRHTVKQVEAFMERWNKDDEFRKDYTRCNVRSTLRRFGTFDGRSLGPDEEPPSLNNTDKNRAAIDSSVSLGPTAVHVETAKDNQKPAEAEEKKDRKPKIKNPVAAVDTEQNNQKPVSRDFDGIEVVVDSREEDERPEEEDDLAKRCEELRKEEEAARVKEKLKVEEKVKAMAALERKKRLAEKARARAAVKALKKVEKRDKEKEKKAMRKERKKAVGGGEASNDAVDEEEPPAGAPAPAEPPKESKTAEKTQKRSQFIKLKKTTSIPPPLRRRGKRKMETWMWILLTVVIVAAVFFLGYGGSLGKLRG